MTQTPAPRSLKARLRSESPARLRLAAAATRLIHRARNRPLPPAPAELPPGAALRVASYNVHKCVGTDGRFDPARIVSVIAELGADLVALQEVDRRFGRRTALLDAAALRRETGLVPLAASPLPDGLGWHGNALLVRPEIHATLRRLALPGAEPRGAVVAELALPRHGALRVVAAHFGLLKRCRRRQAASVLEAIAEGETMPTLLLGDLNEWRPPARSSLRALEGLFGPVPRGPHSFPSRLPILPLDRILGWPGGLVSDVRAHDSLLARVASDHLPLTACLHLARVEQAAAVAQAAPA